MAVPPKHLAVSISCHAWNADGTMCAICPNNNEVHIYSVNGDNWERQTILKEHDLLVTAIDWGKTKNRLVTCSQDRNAFVWTFESGQWLPVLVILRINRAATDVKWSPNEDKFAVASGSKVVCVCYFEEDNDWWVSKHIKKHKSTVTNVSWHPNNILLATASTDFKARVASAFIRGVDKRPSETPFGTKLPFGEILWEQGVPGWVHAIDWAPDGNSLAYVAHDGSINFATFSDGQGSVQTIKGNQLPFRCVRYISQTQVVAAGYDCNPYLFSGQGEFQFQKKIDGGAKPAAKKAANNAFKMFQNKVDRGEDSGTYGLNTIHQNAISGICLMGGNRFSTCGVDGKICIWNV